MKKNDRRRYGLSIGYLLVALIGAWLFQSLLFTPLVRQQQEVPYSEFRQQLAQGNIDEVILENDRIYYTCCTPPEGDQTGQMYNVVRVQDPDLVADLTAAGVTFRATPPANSTLTGLLGFVIPFLPMLLLGFLLFRRMGGQGGTDLWMTTRPYGGEWRPAVNLGAMVNTVGDELAPAMAADNKTLYFSSDQHPGMGGLDVYRTVYAGAAWSAPVHMGTPINSEEDDYFCGLFLNSKDMMFASTRGGGRGGLDLYLAVPNPLPPSAVTTVTGRVSDSNTDAPLGATLTIRDIRSNAIVSSFHSDDVDGSYIVVLQPGRDYVMTAESQGYLFYSERFSIPDDAGNDMIRKDVKLTRDLVRLLVFFDFDKATMKSESYVDLDRAADWLRANPDMRVEVAGHTDNVGARDYNRKLSQDRAEAVVQYLIGKGIPSSRLRAAGYGMDQPIVGNDTEEGRAQNRRVEFRVVAR